MRLIFIILFTVTSYHNFAQINVVSEQQHLAVIRKGQKIFINREDYLKDRIYKVTGADDTVLVLMADKAFFKFRKDTLVAWALVNQIDEQYGIFTLPIVYDVKFPFRHIINKSTYGYDQGNKLATMIVELKKGVSISVIKRDSDFFQIDFKGKLAYVFEPEIIDTPSLHPLRIALSESNYNTPLESNNSSRVVNTYYKGSKGGCYYLNSAGKKIYVDRSMCN